MKEKQAKKLFSSLLLISFKAGTALVLTLVIFLLFPLLNDIFKGDRLKKEEKEVSPKTILMEMTVKKPKPKKVEPRKMRQLSQSTVRSNRSSSSKSAKFSPDLALGGGDGVGVEAGGGFGDMVFDEGDTDEPPMAIRRTALEYPKAAQRARIEGTVEVVFLVNRDGHVQDVEFTKVPHKMFEKPIRSTIMTWRFKPAMLKGVPVSVRVRQKVDFNLRK